MGSLPLSFLSPGSMPGTFQCYLLYAHDYSLLQFESHFTSGETGAPAGQ